MGIITLNTRLFLITMFAAAALCFIYTGNAMALTSADCAECHAPIVADPISPHHNLATQQALSCSACHRMASPTCTDCHGDPIIDPAFHENIHSNISIAPDCSSCHSNPDIIPVTHSNNCTVCHDSTNQVVIDTIAAGSQGTAVNCENCHGALSEVHTPTHAQISIATDCAGCHGDPAIVPVTHSDNCATCHNSTDQAVIDTITAGFNGTQVDCNNCHISINHTAQHDQTFVPEAICADCHDGNVAVEHTVNHSSTCTACHNDPLLASIIDSGKAGNAVVCTDCHTATTLASHNSLHDKTVLPSDGCIECHDANVAVEHVDNRSIGCTDCHNSTRQEVLDAIANGISGMTVNCSDCHLGPLDHQAAHDMTRTDDVSCQDCHNQNVVTEHVDNQGISCSSCHDDPMIQTIIASGVAGNIVVCADCHIMSDHTNAHNNTDVTDSACLECHDPDVSVEHVANGGLSCLVCHGNTTYDAIIDSGKGIAGTLVTCDACHTNAGDHTAAHDMTSLNSGDCAECHNANVVTEHVDVRLLSCSTCHSSTDATVRAVIESGQNGQEVFCSDCHVGAGMHSDEHDMVDVPDSLCADCHNGNVVIEHVDNRALTCNTCHGDPELQRIIQSGMNGTALDCYDCHMTTDHAAEHDNTDVPSAECAECHDGNVTVEHIDNRGLSCLVCHGSATYDSIIAAGQTGTQVTCTDCHGAADHSAAHDMTVVPQAVCADCHDPNVVVEHVDNRGFDCGICHNSSYQGIIDSGIAGNQVSCLNCHNTPDHHANSNDAKSGNCTLCHQVTSSAMDAPVIGACRECHINNQGYVLQKNLSSVLTSHRINTQGDIQDFGACITCHNYSSNSAPYVQPYHAKPSSKPRYYINNITEAPGRGSFNLFYDQWHRNSGEDNEGKEPGCGEDSSCNGSSWRNPEISFQWLTIDYNGNLYDVPAFSDSGNRPDGGGPPVDPPTGGGCEIDANGTYVESENYNALGNNWSVQSGDGNGNGYLYATANSTSSVSGSPAEYDLTFTESGTYYIWFRGKDNGSSDDNSLWYGVDGSMKGNATTPATNNNWSWTRTPHNTGPNPTRITINSAGTYTVTIWARENGFRFDGFYVTKSSSSISGSIPSGADIVDPTNCGGGGEPPVDPPPANDDSVNITYADYSSWRDRLRVYAENDLDDEANLSLTWCGESYSMSYISSNDRWEKEVNNVNDCGDVTVTSDRGGSDTATAN